MPEDGLFGDLSESSMSNSEQNVHAALDDYDDDDEDKTINFRTKST